MDLLVSFQCSIAHLVSFIYWSPKEPEVSNNLLPTNSFEFVGYERVPCMLSFATPCLSFTENTIHQAGTRVFFWASNAQIVYGSVDSTSRMPDVSVFYHFNHFLLRFSQGTLVLTIKLDGGRTVSLP